MRKLFLISLIFAISLFLNISAWPQTGTSVKEAVNAYNSGKIIKAESMFKELLNSNPDSFVPWFYLGEICLKNSSYKQAC